MRSIQYTKNVLVLNIFTKEVQRDKTAPVTLNSLNSVSLLLGYLYHSGLSLAVLCFTRDDQIANFYYLILSFF